MTLHSIMRSALPLALAVSLPLAAHADRVILKSGGQIEGRLVDDETRDKQYVVETDYGGRFVIDRFDVDRIEQQGDADREYEQRARTSPDTVAAHWELAQWCRDNNLTEASERHLERILELDPQHAEARSLLGFRSVQGQWLTREDLMAARGMKWHRGKFRSQQEIELLERHEQSQATAGQWRARITRWRRQLSDRDPVRVREAHDNITAIKDPAAAEVLVDLLAKEENFEVKRLLLEVLAGITHHVAVEALVDRALYDDSEELRAESLDLLIRSKQPGIAGPFIRALRHRDNVIVNRAAQALREIGDPSAIKPLIEALVTQHTFVGGGPPGQHSYTMNGSGVMSFGGGGPKVERRKLKNPPVLSALVALTGGTSFEYDQPRWRKWLATQRHTQEIDLRRDE